MTIFYRLHYEVGAMTPNRVRFHSTPLYVSIDSILDGKKQPGKHNTLKNKDKIHHREREWKEEREQGARPSGNPGSPA
jgi:hypothetical protein